jgi:hypothetical protein
MRFIAKICWIFEEDSMLTRDGILPCVATAKMFPIRFFVGIKMDLAPRSSNLETSPKLATECASLHKITAA